MGDNASLSPVEGVASRVLPVLLVTSRCPLGDVQPLADDRVETPPLRARRLARTKPAKPCGLAPWQIRRLEAHIAHNLSGGLRVSGVAALVSLSPSYFSRAFKASFGVTLSQYVIQQRIALAKQRLMSADRSIAEIALICGFSDQAHLTRLFKRATGTPPRAWRRAKALTN